MPRQRKLPIWVVGIIERADNHVLICRPEGEPPSLWDFPGGPANQAESPERAMRRLSRETVGMDVEIIVGQPPLVGKRDAKEYEMRYFFCGRVSGEGETSRPMELRWILKGQLREYEFVAPTTDVVDWYLS